MKPIGGSGLAVLRSGLGALGVLIAVLPFVGPLSPPGGGLSVVHQWWLATAGGGVCLIAAAVGTQWLSTAVLAAALLVGGSAQLAVTRLEVFHFIYIRPTANISYFVLLSIAFQGAATAALLLRPARLAGIFRFLRALGPWRTALLAVLLAAFSMSAMRYIGSGDFREYLVQLFMASAFVLLNLGTTVAIALSAPAPALGALAGRVAGAVSLPAAAERLRPFDRRLPAIVALWVLVAASLVSIFGFERIPHVVDEAVYLFQSKYFLQGEISAAAPSVVKPFKIALIDFIDGRWFSIMPPGWPAVLALGTAVGLPWFVNPLLAAACILLAHGVFRRVTDRGTANLIVVLLAVSPWFLAMSASLMAHTLTLAAGLASWLLLLRARAAPSLALAFLAGLSMGLVFLARYLDGVVLGVLTGLWTLTFLADRAQWRVVVGYGLGCIALGALVFPYNLALTGDALLTTLTHYFNDLWHVGADGYGFGPNIGPGPGSNWQGELYPGHSPTEALIHFQHNSQATNRELFGWGLGSLIFAFVHLLWGKWSRTDLYMGAVVVAIVGALSCFWFSGGFYIGARYWFLILLPLAVITASGVGTLARRLEAFRGGAFAAPRVGVALAVLCVFSVGAFLPWRSVDKYPHYRNFNTDYRELVKRHDLTGSLVIVKASSLDDYTSAFILNAPDLSGPGPVFARDLGSASNRALARAFPGRPIYLVAGRGRDGTRARIVAGPLAADALP